MFLSVYKVVFSTEFCQMVSCCDFLHQKENATSTKDWIWDKEELESAFTEKTRAIVINTPHNPIGKVKIHIVFLQIWGKVDLFISVRVALIIVFVKLLETS